MQEKFNQLVDELHGALRYRWPAIGAAWTACLLGWALTMVLPNVYESNARIFADTSTALTPVIKGLAIEQDVAAQLNLVQQSLLSDAQLEQVIAETDLASEATTTERRA